MKVISSDNLHSRALSHRMDPPSDVTSQASTNSQLLIGESITFDGPNRRSGFLPLKLAGLLPSFSIASEREALMNQGQGKFCIGPAPAQNFCAPAAQQDPKFPRLPICTPTAVHLQKNNAHCDKPTDQRRSTFASAQSWLDFSRLH